jgi:hypothetical protein
MALEHLSGKFYTPKAANLQLSTGDFNVRINVELNF